MDEYDFAAELDDDEQLSALAALAVLEKRVKDAMSRLKARQRDRIGMGHGAKAFLNHAEAASVSVTKDGDGKFVVKDAEAFARVLVGLGDDPEDPESRLRLVVLPKPSAMTAEALKELVESHGGEVPDGVDWKNGVLSTVKIQLEKTVKDEPLDLSNLLGLPQLLGIEAPKPVDKDSTDVEEDPWNRV
jgi:hypothetical protein